MTIEKLETVPGTLISILIPAFNEAARIGATVQAVRELTAQGQAGFQVVVIDDGSSDDTTLAAERAGADLVIRQSANGGKGAALRAGLARAQGGILVLLDADLGRTAFEAGKLIAPVQDGRADMTIALFQRPTSDALDVKGGGVGLVVRLARWGIRRLTGRTMAAPLSGQRVVRREVLEAVGGFADGWGVEVALTVGALRGGFRVEEVPTMMTHRVTGRGGRDIAHRAAQFVGAARTLQTLWRHYGAYRPPADLSHTSGFGEQP